MKNTETNAAKRRCILAIAVAAVIGLSFAALSLTGCSGGSGNGGGYGDGTPEYGGGTPGGKTPDGQTPGGGSGLGPNNEVPGNTLAAQLTWLQSNAQSDTAYTLTARADETVPVSLGYGDKNNITVTIKGSGGERIISGYGSGYVGNGVTLIMDENITFIYNENGNCINLYGALVMNDGAKIIGSTSACVAIVNDGTFTMNGGTISGGYAGVSMGKSGTFTMNGGTISDNTSYGVSVVGEFTMNDGTISGNGCGVVMSDEGLFIMNGGEISGNGGGVNMPSGKETFIMNDGTISGNTKNGHGGGVCLSSYTAPGGTFTMNGGKISGNTAIGDGGGVYVYYSGTFTMNGGEISGNKVNKMETTNRSGGGIYVSGNNAIFRISNGIVYGSEASENKANIAPTQSYYGNTIYYGSSLCKADDTAKAQYGTGDTWNNIPLDYNTNDRTREATIKVVNGVLQP